MQILSVKKLNYTLFTVLFFISYFLFTWLYIDPVIIHYWQDQVFLVDMDFFYKFLAYPGGLLDYLSSFLTQFYIYPAAGAFIITGVTYLICNATRHLMQSVENKHSFNVIHFIPAIFLLIFHSDYNYPISMALGILFSLLFFTLYLKTGNHNYIKNILIYIISALILYYISAGSLLFYSLLCLLYLLTSSELPGQTKIIHGVIIVGLAICLPFITARYIFFINLDDAYLLSLQLMQAQKLSFLAILFYLFFSVIITREILKQNDLVKNIMAGKIKINLKEQMIMLFIIAVFTGWYIILTSNKTVFKIGHRAQQNRWEEIIKILEKKKIVPISSIFHINRALYHSGRLLDEMFAYPQQYGTDGLFIPGKFALEFPFPNCQFYFELGHVNEAQHWAHEALTLKGPTSSILKQLALINITKHQYRAAYKFLNVLQKTLFSERWVEKYTKYLNQKSLIEMDPLIVNLHAKMPNTDFNFYSEHSIIELAVLLKKDKKNKMAFEYLIANYLLKIKLKELVTNLQYLKYLEYPDIPNHYQEALLIYQINFEKDSINWAGYQISQEIINRFADYNQILASNNNDKNLAKNILYEKHGDTFWYYLMYLTPYKW